MSVATVAFVAGVCILLQTSDASDAPSPPAAATADEQLRTAPDKHVGKPVKEPEGYRTSDYRMPVPATLQGATVLSNAQASDVWSSKRAVFIDVYPHAPKPPNLPVGTLWRETTHQTIEGAKWVPNVGYGVLSAAAETYFRQQLERLSGGDRAKPLVFFCLSDCWMSWNAAKRAITYGYTAVHWYPEGSDGWQAIGQFVVDAVPET